MNASFWPRLVPALLVFVPLIAAYRLRPSSALRLVGGIILVMLARDVAFSLVKEVKLYQLSELVILMLYLGWLRTFTGWRRTDSVLLGVNALAVLAGVADTLFSLVPQGEFFVGLWLLSNVAYFAVNAGLVSPLETENAGPVLAARFPLIAALFIIHLVALLYGWDHPAVQGILVPAAYLLPALLAVTYNRYIHTEEQRSVQFFSSNLDATYGFMENLGNAITAKIDLSQVLQIILTAAVRNIGADAGAVLMVDEYEDLLRVRATYGIHPPLGPVPEIARVTPASLKKYFAETPVPVGQTILGEAVTSGKPLLVRDARADERLAHNSADDILYVSSLAVIPLVVRQRVLGVLSVAKRVEGRYLEERDFQHLATLAEYASITIDNIYTYMEVLEKREIEREVDIAAQIQQKLLPARLPEMGGASLAVFNKPAKGVSGDYYDVFRLGGDKIGIAICDVAGKGIPAALVMVMIRSILHLVVSPERDAAATLGWVNRGITGRIDLDHFATIAVLIYDEKRREILYSNAAHLPLLVYRQKTGSTFKVDTEGLPIGIEKDTRYEQKRFGLEAGDVILMCTDGIIEAMNLEGQQYGVAGVRRMLEKGAVLPPQELVESIQEDIGRFVGSARQHDDQTLLVLKAQ